MIPYIFPKHIFSVKCRLFYARQIAKKCSSVWRWPGFNHLVLEAAVLIINPPALPILSILTANFKYWLKMILSRIGIRPVKSAHTLRPTVPTPSTPGPSSLICSTTPRIRFTTWRRARSIRYSRWQICWLNRSEKDHDRDIVAVRLRRR